MREIKRIFIHVSASPDDKDWGLKEIKHLHTAPKTEKIQWGKYATTGRAWSDVGYHWIVRRDGTVEQGRPESRAGAHARGHNSDSIAIVWMGENDQTEAQKKAIRELVEKKIKEHGLKKEDVYGHYEVEPLKTCPNMDMDAFRESLFFCCGKGCDNHKVSNRKEEYLPDGPSETDIDVTLEDIENQILK